MTRQLPMRYKESSKLKQLRNHGPRKSLNTPIPIQDYVYIVDLDREASLALNLHIIIEEHRKRKNIVVCPAT